MKKITLLSFLFRPHIGGVENSLESLAESFQRFGYDVELFCTDQPAEWNLSESELIKSIKVRRFKWRNVKGLIFPFNLFYNMFLLSKWLGGMLSSNTICISRHHIMSVALYLGTKKDYIYIVPEVVMKTSPHSSKRSFKYTFIMWVNHKIQAYAIKKAKFTYVFSENVQQQLKSVGIFSETSIVNPGIDKKKFEKSQRLARQELGLDDNNIYLLGLGRIIQAKGFDFIIESLQFIDNDKIKLLIVGEGPYLNELKQKVEILKLNSQIEFTGKTDRPELFFLASDIFIMSSLNEAFGQTLLEAAFAHKPIVAFERGEFVQTATEEIFGLHDAIFYSKLTPIDLAGAINNAIEEYVKKGKKADYSVIESKYSWDSLALKLLK